MSFVNSVQILTGGQLLLGSWCIFYRWLYGRRAADRSPIAWRSSWTNFFLFTWIGLTIVLLFPLLFQPLFQHSPEPWIDFSAGFCAQGFLLAVLLWFFFRNEWSFRKNSFWGKSPHLIRHALFEYFWVTPILFFISVLWLAPLYLLNAWGYPVSLQQQDLAETILTTSSNAFLFTAGIMAILVAPITEELFFRAGIYRFLKTKISKKWAIFWTSLLFAFLHTNCLAFLPIFFLGIFLIQIYERHQNLWVNIGVHSLFNVNSFLLLLLSRSLS